MPPLSWIVFPLVLFTGGQAFAQGQPVDCSQAPSNVEMSECLDRELKREDVALNRIYQEALRSTRDNDSMPAAERRKWQAAVRDSQRKWIAFRHADCKTLPFLSSTAAAASASPWSRAWWRRPRRAREISPNAT